MSSIWPKKISATKYTDHWYACRSSRTTINEIKRGHLPGGQDPSGHWYVWVNSDLSPAYDYEPPKLNDIAPPPTAVHANKPISSAAKAAVDRIMEKASQRP